MHTRAPLSAAFVLILALVVLSACSGDDRGAATGAPPTVLSRAGAALVLTADSLWTSRDAWSTYAYQRANMTCDDWRRISADDPLHRVVDTERLITYVDSSSIGVDSVAHVCVELPTDDARSLELTPGLTHLPNMYFAVGATSHEPHRIHLRTHRARLDSVTGIVQAPGAPEADVEFSVRRDPTPYATAGASEPSVRVTRASARVTRYDDGWRVVDMR